MEEPETSGDFNRVVLNLERKEKLLSIHIAGIFYGKKVKTKTSREMNLFIPYVLACKCFKFFPTFRYMLIRKY